VAATASPAFRIRRVARNMIPFPEEMSEEAVGGLKSLKKLAHRWSVGMSQFEEGVRDATSKEPYACI
jgi:hypothetical protein